MLVCVCGPSWLNVVHSSREQRIVRSVMSDIRRSNFPFLAGHCFHGATTGQSPESGGGAYSNRSCPGAVLAGASASSRGLVSLRLVSRERRVGLGLGGETPSGAKANSMEMAAVWYHFAPWQKNLRKGHKQHSALGLRRAGRSGRGHGPGRQVIRARGRGDRPGDYWGKRQAKA
jgi:hypothetical protein